MILWKEAAERTDRPVVLKALIPAGLVLAGLGTVVLSVAHYHGRIRPDLRSAAGEIELKRLTSTVSSRSVFGEAKGKGNAAAHYIRALNSYAARRVPYLKNRTFKAFVKEPPVSAAEIAELDLGARRADCDFYSVNIGGPDFRLLRPGKEPWPFRRAVLPDETRPYYTPLRLLLVGLLYQADSLVKAGKPGEANRIYLLVVRVGSHIRQKPGCLLDVELALEVEDRAILALESLARATNRSFLSKVVQYRKAIEKLEQRLNRKYSQLDNPEAAAIIAAHDTDPIWRIEAAAALRDQPYHHALGILERRTIRSAFERTFHDPNPLVRSAASRLANSAPAPSKGDNARPL